MNNAQYDVVAIGNAMVDVIAHATDEFIEEQGRLHGMHKGAMTLISEERAVQLYSDMGPAVESSGGSAGNTMAGFASFGGRGAYIGKVADDQLGQVFRHDLKSLGVTYETTPLVVGAPTGRCLILVTPDGERTMNTFIGAGQELSTVDVDRQMIAASKITYLEGYLFDQKHAKEAFVEAAKIAHDAGNRVALTLSDPFCVDRHRDDFLSLVEGHIDLLFANEHEIMSLYQTETFEQAAKAVMHKCEVAALTRSEKGAVIITGDNEFVEVSAEENVKVEDTTGAGDQYAAGFLFGFTRNLPVHVCGRLGSMAAAEVISHIGPRPETDYSDFIELAMAA